MARVPAGWYPDPAELTRVRWFDGAKWTDHVRTVADPVEAVHEPPAPVSAPRPTSAVAGPATVLAHGSARRRFSLR